MGSYKIIYTQRQRTGANEHTWFEHIMHENRVEAQRTTIDR